MKKNFLKNPNFYYYLFVIIAALELIASILGIFLDLSITSRDNAVNNVFLSVLAIALMSIPKYLKEKYNFRFNNWIEILILVFLFASIVLGFIQEFYETVRGYDKLVHMISGVVLALVAFESVYIYSGYVAKKKNQSIPTLFIVLFSFTFSITLLVLWEFYEFLTDVITFNLMNNPTNMQRYQWPSTSTFYPQDYGLLDTMLDLLIGAAGSFVVAIVAFVFLNKHEKIEPLLTERDQE